MPMEFHKGQRILKEHLQLNIRFGNSTNRKQLFVLMNKAGYIKMNRGGRSFVVKKDITFK